MCQLIPSSPFPVTAPAVRWTAGGIDATLPRMHGRHEPGHMVDVSKTAYVPAAPRCVQSRCELHGASLEEGLLLVPREAAAEGLLGVQEGTPLGAREAAAPVTRRGSVIAAAGTDRVIASAILIGAVAGLTPAIRASRLPPAVALRT